MNEVEFSLISDDEEDLEGLHLLLQAFESRQRVKVNLNLISWEAAWSTLLVNALHGKGPHVSHVGSTWSTTLGTMEALRPFKANDLAELGAPEAFIPLTWKSAMRGGGERIWAIPWTAYTFILCYRRDLLSKAGLDETTAFATPLAFQQSLEHLQARGVKYPWVFPTPQNNPDLIHIVANWVWGVHGEFINADGTEALFALPEARNGFRSFFKLFRYLPGFAQGLTYDQCSELFSSGEAAVAILGADDAISLWKDEATEAVVRENLGTAVLPGVPWVGGDNLVIWKHAYGSNEINARALVKYLTTYEIQLQFAQLHNSLPVRTDALGKFLKDMPPFVNVIETTFERGRPHASVRLWSRFEHQLGEALNQIAAQVIADSSSDPGPIIQKRLEPLEKSINLLLKN